MQETRYNIPNNTHKILLAGEGEANFRMIEAQTGVKLVSREEGLKIISEDVGSIRQAIEILDRMRLALKQGADLDSFLVRRILEPESTTIPQSGEEYEPSGVVLMRNRFGQPVQPRTDGQLELVQMAEKHDVVFANGPAGTGKTFLAVAMAVAALEQKQVERIFLVRPAVEAGENLGFLPGDLKEKIAPYLRPIYDALQELLPRDKLRTYNDGNAIEIAPLAYMRGRTLKRAFIILDEAQNTTIPQMKMFLTRLGPNSKAIITGDESQIDLGPRDRSGFSHALQLLADVPGIAQVHLSASEVLRHKLVQQIIEAYETVQ